MVNPACFPCCNLGGKSSRQSETNLSVMQSLCAITTILSHEDFEVLCDPGTGTAVLLVPTFNADGTIASVAAYNLDGTAYAGVVADLVACGGAVTIAGMLHAEDTLHVSGDLGVEMLARRADAPTSSTATDGNYATLNTDATGRLWTNALVTNAAGAAAVNIQDGGNVITVDGTVTATVLGQYAEDSLHVSGDIGLFALAIRSDVAASTAGATGEYAGIIQDANGKLWTNAEVTNAAGAAAVNIQDGGNVITVDGTVTVGAQTLVEANYVTDVTAFGAIGAAQAVVLVDANPKKILDFDNNTDAVIAISFDNATDHITLRPGRSYLIDEAPSGLMESSSISIRYVGAAPTAGDFYINVTY